MFLFHIHTHTVWKTVVRWTVEIINTIRGFCQCTSGSCKPCQTPGRRRVCTIKCQQQHQRHHGDLVTRSSDVTGVGGGKRSSSCQWLSASITHTADAISPERMRRMWNQTSHAELGFCICESVASPMAAGTTEGRLRRNTTHATVHGKPLPAAIRTSSIQIPSGSTWISGEPESSESRIYAADLFSIATIATSSNPLQLSSPLKIPMSVSDAALWPLGLSEVPAALHCINLTPLWVWQDGD